MPTRWPAPQYDHEPLGVLHCGVPTTTTPPISITASGILTPAVILGADSVRKGKNRKHDDTPPFSSDVFGGRRFETQLLSLFAVLALLLSAAGLYASLAYQVALRTREIGIRSALGARRQSIVTMIVSKGMRLAFAGVVFGVAGAAAAARMIQSLLYETSAVDPASHAAATAFLLLVAAGGAWLPARRAAAISPLTALRDG